MPRKGMRSLLPHPLSQSPRKPAGAGAVAVATFQEVLMEDSIASAEQIIRRWDPEGSDYARITSLFHESRDEAARFISVVSDLHRDMLSFARSNPHSPILVRAQGLMNAAVKRLQKEFYQILAANRDRLDSDSVASSTRSSVSTRPSDAEEEQDEAFDAVSVAVFTDEDEVEADDDVRVQQHASAGGAADPVQRFPLAIMASLRSIAHCMVSTGYAYECIEAYKRARRSVVHEGLARLGFDLSVAAPVTPGGRDGGAVLDRRVAAWVTAVPAAIRSLFFGERLLADFIFANDEKPNHSTVSTTAAAPVNESCFTLVTVDAAVRLLAFPERVAAGILKWTAGSPRSKRPSPDVIFGLLDMYNALADLWPEVDATFSYNSASEVPRQLVSSILRLSEAVRAVLDDFELSIQKDASKATVPGGGFHQLTQYVMDYVGCLADEYSTALSEIYADSSFQPKTTAPDVLSAYISNASSSSLPSSPYPERKEENQYSLAHSPSFAPSSHYTTASNNVSARLAWLLLVLLCKLDEKAKRYKDAALSYLFLANNLRYMTSRVCDSTRLRHFLGGDWATTHDYKARSFFRSFERLAWNSVVSAIPADGGMFVLETEGVAGARERMRQFSCAFKEAYKKQASWRVTDQETREMLRASLAATIAEPYRLFHERCRPVLRRDRESIGVVQFPPQDVADYLADMYEPENRDASPSSSVSGSGTQSPRSPDHSSSSGASRRIWRTAIRRFSGRPGNRPDRGA